MSIRVWGGLVAVVIAAGACAQQLPALPAINATTARADGVLGGLDGPAFGLVPDGDRGVLVAACEGGTLHTWRRDALLGVRSSQTSPNLVKAHDGPITALAGTSGVFASGGADGKIHVWAFPADERKHTFDAGSAVRALSIDPAGKVIASAAEGNEIQLWDADSGKAGQKLAGPTDWTLALAFAPDGKTVAAGGYDGSLRVWEVGSGKKVVEVKAQAATVPNQPPPSANVVNSLAFSPDGKTIAVGGSDSQVHLFQTGDGKLIRSMPGHTSAVAGLAFHPSGALLASAGKDRTVRLWNPANGQLVKALEGHTSWVQGVAFFARGTRVASAGADGTVRLWDLTESKK